MSCHLSTYMVFSIFEGFQPLKPPTLGVCIPSGPYDYQLTQIHLLPRVPAPCPLGPTGPRPTCAGVPPPPLRGSQHTKGPCPAPLHSGTLYRPGSGQTPGSSTSLVPYATTCLRGPLRVLSLATEAKGPHQGTTPTLWYYRPFLCLREYLKSTRRYLYPLYWDKLPTT